MSKLVLCPGRTPATWGNSHPHPRARSFKQQITSTNAHGSILPHCLVKVCQPPPVPLGTGYSWPRLAPASAEPSACPEPQLQAGFLGRWPWRPAPLLRWAGAPVIDFFKMFSVLTPFCPVASFSLEPRLLPASWGGQTAREKHMSQTWELRGREEPSQPHGAAPLSPASPGTQVPPQLTSRASAAGPTDPHTGTEE